LSIKSKKTSIRILGTNNVSRISLKNVNDIFEKHKDEESKGIKAHFRVDDSGLINLDKVIMISFISSLCQFK
jgi:hypoxia up-regulated 1